MQPAFKEKCSYTMAVRGLLGGRLVMEHRLWWQLLLLVRQRPHCLECFVAWDPDEDGGAVVAVVFKGLTRRPDPW